jgi:hypothetical protein
MFGTKHWQEDNWQRNRFFFGKIKINWTPFCIGTPRIQSANNNYQKIVFPFLKFSESKQFDSNINACRKYFV